MKRHVVLTFPWKTAENIPPNPSPFHLWPQNDNELSGRVPTKSPCICGSFLFSQCGSSISTLFFMLLVFSSWVAVDTLLLPIPSSESCHFKAVRLLFKKKKAVRLSLRRRQWRQWLCLPRWLQSQLPRLWRKRQGITVLIQLLLLLPTLWIVLLPIPFLLVHGFLGTSSLCLAFENLGFKLHLNLFNFNIPSVSFSFRRNVKLEFNNRIVHDCRCKNGS